MTSSHTEDTRARAPDARTLIARGRALAEMSQETLAEYLRIDPRTLRRYEAGELPTPDALMLEVAELAGQPLLVYEHFRTKYGIADEILPPMQAVPLALAVVNLLHELEKLERGRVASRLLELSHDGVIDAGEDADFNMIMDKLQGVRRAVDMLRYCDRRNEDA